MMLRRRQHYYLLTPRADAPAYADERLTPGFEAAALRSHRLLPTQNVELLTAVAAVQLGMTASFAAT